MFSSNSKNSFKSLFINNLTKTKLSFFLILFLGNLINLFSISFVFSQSDTTFIETSDPSTPLDSTLLPQKTKAAVSLGFRGGITRGRFEITNPEEADQNDAGTGSVLSFLVNYRFNSHFSLQPELSLGRYRSDNTLYKTALREGRVDYTLSTFDLNLLGIYSYPIKDWLSISAEGGISAAYLFSSFGKVVAPNEFLVPSYDVNSDQQFEKLNYGAIVGISPSFNFKNVTLQTSIRYRHGLNNINSFDYSLNRYLANEERTIQTRDILFQVGFLFPLYRKVKVISN